MNKRFSFSAKENGLRGCEGSLKDGVDNQGFELESQAVDMANQEEPDVSKKTSAKGFGLQKM